MAAAQPSSLVKGGVRVRTRRLYTDEVGPVKQPSRACPHHDWTRGAAIPYRTNHAIVRVVKLAEFWLNV